MNIYEKESIERRIWSFLKEIGDEFKIDESKLLDSRAIERAVEECVKAIQRLEKLTCEHDWDLPYSNCTKCGMVKE